MKIWFQEYGFPKKTMTDYGPQFRFQFTIFQWAIIKENSFIDVNAMEQEVSSAYNPSSKGHEKNNSDSLKTILNKILMWERNLEATLSV